MSPLKPLPHPSLLLHFLTRALRHPARHPQTAFSTRQHPSIRRTQHLRKPRPSTRPYSTTPTPPQPPPPPSSRAATRAERILARLPRPLQRYTARLRGAPVAHVVAFLILHEITAVVPLLGFFGLFHYTECAPVAWMAAHYGGYVGEGVARFERWFTRRGLFGFGRGSGDSGKVGVASDGMVETVSGEVGADGPRDATTAADGVGDTVLQRWEQDPKYRVVVEIGLAYAITKVLLPARIVVSVWATPWFAGVLGRLRRIVGR